MNLRPHQRPTLLFAVAGLLSVTDVATSQTLEKGWHWSAAGHARTMYESYHGADFGLGPVDDDDWVHQRVQIMGTVAHGDRLKLAAELTWGRMWGKEASLAPPDEDEVDALQLYLESRIPIGSDHVEMRAGRQTLYYGSGRLLASREGANQRLAHDAFRASWVKGENHRTDAFVASPVEIEPNSFDNASDLSRILFWGIYAVTPVGRGNFLDAYYIGLRDEDSIFTSEGGREVRHTVGVRAWNKGDSFIYNTELILQLGEAGDRQIRAGAASLEVGYVLSTFGWNPTPQLRADVISGGDEADSVRTFHPLFQANNYFNEGGFLSPSNLYNINPLLKLQPSDVGLVSLGVNFQWLFTTGDSIYGPPLQRLGQPVAGGERYLGTAFNASVEWEFAKGASLFVGYTHHHAGPALTAIGGKSVDYVQASFRWEF